MQNFTARGRSRTSRSFAVDATPVPRARIGRMGRSHPSPGCRKGLPTRQQGRPRNVAVRGVPGRGVGTNSGKRKVYVQGEEAFAVES